MEYGFALGGGGAKSFAQLGAIKAFAECGVLPSYFSGSSMGAVNAVLLSAGYSVREIICFYKKKKRFGLFRLGFFKVDNRPLAKACLELCSLKGYRNLEDLPIKVYIPTTLPDSGLRIILRKGRIDNVIAASTSSYLIRKYLVNDIAIKKQIIEQTEGVIGHGRVLYLKDSCYSSNVPFELLKLIRKENPSFDQKNYFDIAFDVIPSFKKTYFVGLDSFNLKILANDHNRFLFFSEENKGLYLKLDFGISQTEFTKKTINRGVGDGYKYVMKIIEERKMKK